MFEKRIEDQVKAVCAALVLCVAPLSIPAHAEAKFSSQAFVEFFIDGDGECPGAGCPMRIVTPQDCASGDECLQQIGLIKRSARQGCLSGSAPCAKTRSTAPTGFDLLITFPAGSADISLDIRATLDELAQALKNSKLVEKQFLIAGHSDAKGDDALNVSLSIARAEAIRAYLLTRGIEPHRLFSRGFGESLPVADDPNSPVNRRVEIREISVKAAVPTPRQ
ncbi:MAG: OmpA family protein [Paracoccaceae bacterium]